MTSFLPYQFKMANQPPFLRFMMINKNRSKNFTWNFANAFQIMLKTLIINIIITINNLREFLGHWLIELSYILYFTICSRENIEFYIIEDVQSTWDRTYFLMLVFSADPAGRRRDRQTDRHIKGTPLGSGPSGNKWNNFRTNICSGLLCYTIQV